MHSTFRDTTSSRIAVLFAIALIGVFGIGVGLAIIAIKSDDSSEALATLAAFLLGGVFGFIAYIGREFLITRNVIRALAQEIDNAHYQCKMHLNKSNYEDAKRKIKEDNAYIPYIGWQPIPHSLYRKAIEELFLLTEDVIQTIQKAYDSEYTIEIMVAKLEGTVFKEMKPERRSSFMDTLRGAIEEDESNLKEANELLRGYDVFRRFFWG